jgi:hypothetical protein
MYHVLLQVLATNLVNIRFLFGKAEVLEDFILDAGEEGLGEYLIDDDMLPGLRSVVLLGEGLYVALAKEPRGKVRCRIGEATLEVVCRADFLALCWPRIVGGRLGASPRHHVSRSRHLRSGWNWKGNKVRLGGLQGRTKPSPAWGTESSSLGVSAWNRNHCIWTSGPRRDNATLGLDLKTSVQALRCWWPACHQSHVRLRICRPQAPYNVTHS